MISKLLKILPGQKQDKPVSSGAQIHDYAQHAHDDDDDTTNPAGGCGCGHRH